MNEEQSGGSTPKIISIAVLISIVLLFPFSKDVAYLLKATPIILAPFFLIWSPGSALEYFSSHTTENDIHWWGVIGLLLITIPFGLIMLSSFFAKG